MIIRDNQHHHFVTELQCGVKKKKKIVTAYFKIQNDWPFEVEFRKLLYDTACCRVSPLLELCTTVYVSRSTKQKSWLCCRSHQLPSSARHNTCLRWISSRTAGGTRWTAAMNSNFACSAVVCLSVAVFLRTARSVSWLLALATSLATDMLPVLDHTSHQRWWHAPSIY